MSDANTTPAEVKPKSNLMFKLGIVGFVVLVVGVECVVAYLFLPKLGGAQAAAAADEETHAAQPEPKAAHAEKEKGKEKEKEKGHAKGGEKEKEKGHAKGGEKEKEGKHEKGEKKGGHGAATGDIVEVDLGEFTVTGTHASSNSTLRVALHLFGTVSAMDSDHFEERMKEVQHRFREQVIVTLRGAQAADLTDAGLGLLKRTILEKTNALLGEPLLKTVVFSEFSFFEM